MVFQYHLFYIPFNSQPGETFYSSPPFYPDQFPFAHLSFQCVKGAVSSDPQANHLLVRASVMCN
jgi:hypothetical protein